MLGLLKDTVKLVVHNAEWSNCFEDEKSRIARGIADYILDIQHFGSTAVPGLDAKPIIDIAIAVQALDDVDKCEHNLNKISYERYPEIIVEGSILFTKGNPTTHHVHFSEQGGANLKKWLFFRDHLRNKAGLIDKYRKLKRDLEKEFEKNREADKRGKGACINEVLKERK